jgi:hypothetical protein
MWQAFGRRVHTARGLHERGGARAVFWHALYVLGYRRTVVVELPLTPPPPRVAVAVETASDFLGHDQLDEYAAFHPDISRDRAAELMARGERCFATWIGARIVSARWVAAGRVHLGDVGLDVELPPHTAYISHSFTSTDMRGMRIAAHSGTELAHRLAHEGWTRLVGTVLPQNRPGLRSAVHAGYREAGRLATLRIAPRRVVRVPYVPRGTRPLV